MARTCLRPAVPTEKRKRWRLQQPHQAIIAMLGLQYPSFTVKSTGIGKGCPWGTPAPRGRSGTDSRSVKQVQVGPGDQKQPLGRGFANFSAGAWRRSANSVTPIPAPPRKDARGDADTREGMSHVGKPAASDRRVPGAPLEGRGWPARGGIRVPWHTVLSSVLPSVRPGTGPARPSGSERSFTVRFRGPPSARHDPHYCFRRRRSADGTALRPAPAACATPSRPRGERRGHAQSRGPTCPPRREECGRPRPPALAQLPPLAPGPPPRAPLRVAHMDPSGPPPSSPCKLQPRAACRSSPTEHGVGVRWAGEKGTYTRGEWIAAKPGS